MAHSFLISNWFFGYDIVLELFFAFITLLVSIYSFKVYKLSKQNHPRLFGLAFLSFSIAYFIQSILNYLILSELNKTVCTAIKLQDVGILTNLGMISHMVFFLIGLITLTYMTLKIKSKTTYFILLISSFISFFLVINKIYWFYVFASLLLIFIAGFYFSNFIKHKQGKTFIVFLAFLFLLFGNIHFIFSVNHLLYYEIGHFLELLAYFLVLTNILLVLKNGKKKK